jgi:hypothetical protein
MSIKFGQRFDELLKQADEILAAAREIPSQGYGLNGIFVDDNQLINWQVKAAHYRRGAGDRSNKHSEGPLLRRDSLELRLPARKADLWRARRLGVREEQT